MKSFAQSTRPPISFEIYLGNNFRRLDAMTRRLLRKGKVGRLEDAEDLTQESAVACWLQVESGSEIEHPWSYWAKAGVNLATKMRRKAERQPAITLDEQTVGSSDRSVDSQLENEDVRAAVSSLPQDQQEVIQAHYGLDMTLREIEQYKVATSRTKADNRLHDSYRQIGEYLTTDRRRTATQ